MFNQSRNGASFNNHVHHFLCKQRQAPNEARAVQRTKAAKNRIPRKKKTKTKEARGRIDLPFFARSARACVARLAAARSDSFHEKVESRTMTCSLTSERRASRAWPVGGAEICRSSSKSSSSFLFWPFLSGRQWSGRAWRSMDEKRRRRGRRRRRSLCLWETQPKVLETRRGREEEEQKKEKKKGAPNGIRDLNTRVSARSEG